MASAAHLAVREALAHPLEGTDFPSLGKKYEGKVRDNYTANGRRTIVVTDRISAFDRVLGTLPLKGQLLNHVAAWWFEKTKAVAPNHVIDVPDPNVLIAEECTPLPVEMIVRAYLTGSTSTSIWVHYQKGARTFCGHSLPEGLKKHQKLPESILTPSTKAAHGDHDVSAAREEILKITGMPAADFDAAADMAMRLFAFGQQTCAARGLILVDTKYEFGKTKDGRIVVIDEIHTPDSSRFWFEGTYGDRFARGEDPESFDKEYVRRWLVSQGFSGDGPIPRIPDDVRVEATNRYVHAVETITGTPFVPNLEIPSRASDVICTWNDTGPNAVASVPLTPRGAAPMKEFKDKVALVTGAASGIGFALADRFASVGMKVVLADVEQGALDAAEKTLKAKGAPVLAVRTDVSKAADVEELATRTYDKFGAVHVLCNNAGVGVGGLSWEHSVEDWQWVLGVNLWGVIHGMRSFVPRMIAQGTDGHIVNTASVAGLISSPYMAVYQATKHAVVAITESLKMELDVTGAKLSASVLCPGFVATRISDSERNRPADLTKPPAATDGTPQQAMIRELARQQIAAGLKPGEIAEMVLEAIRDDRFYVITHPRFKKVIRVRMENILEGKTPRFEPPT